MLPGSRIRVLLTVPHLHSTQSPYREMIGIARYLPRDEFDLTICSLRKNGYEETFPKLQEYGVSCFIARFRPRGKSFGPVIDSLKDQKIIDERGPFDVQHSMDFTSSPFEAYMANRKQRIFIFSQRNLNEGGSAYFLKLKVRQAERIIAISGPVRDFLTANGTPTSKIELIYNGIDFENPKSQDIRADSGSKVLLSVGHIERRKRHEDAIRALSMIVSEIPEARLQIAGAVHDQGYHSELVKLTGDLKLTGKVEFLGVRSDILELMSSSGVLIHCAGSEAFGWAILEAMSARLPVICSAVDGPKEIIENEKTGFLVPTGEVSGYARAIIAIMNDPQKRNRIITEAHQQLAARFSAKKMVDQLAALYRQLPQKKGKLAG